MQLYLCWSITRCFMSMMLIFQYPNKITSSRFSFFCRNIFFNAFINRRSKCLTTYFGLQTFVRYVNGCWTKQQLQWVANPWCMVANLRVCVDA